MPLTNLLISASLISGCSAFQINDYPLTIRLPASRQCYEVRVMTKKKTLYPEAQCDKIVERGVILTSDAWRLMRGDLKSNCQNSQCRQLEGAADGLFLAIDRALQVIP